MDEMKKSVAKDITGNLNDTELEGVSGGIYVRQEDGGESKKNIPLTCSMHPGHETPGNLGDVTRGFTN